MSNEHEDCRVRPLISRLSVLACQLAAAHPEQHATIHEAIATIKRWEAYRSEMADMELRLANLAKKFLDLGAYEDAARCASKAEGMKFVRGRMPERSN